MNARRGNGKIALEGPATLRKAKSENHKESCAMRLLVIGGVAGGASAAARVRRLDAHA